MKVALILSEFEDCLRELWGRAGDLKVLPVKLILY